ncbi:DUF3631 domain-containing protein [Marinobacterium sediminicola]|uniref:DUF3631 domain-containing protein n=1 Tax=Marinobacterium sediminicola TaxID=518898 RepID=A0ABY1S3G6_9GAMM|nr:DUF3631 domain-containing protein [Marinobacterium sediminicola]ULG69296.1 DUF3631 domain-containing protein [Marinobacterium sediminicola]SMR77647.1 Protein of unknown function [Marinobacterium sediminicola]
MTSLKKPDLENSEETLVAGQQIEGTFQNTHAQSSTSVNAEQSPASDKPVSNAANPAHGAVDSLTEAKPQFPERLKPWPDPVDIQATAYAIADRLRLHSVLTEADITATVLWIISSYLINSFRIFPKLSLISPEKRCGKSTLMEVIQSFSHEGLLVSNLSGATIYRITTTVQPTLLIDEADTFVKGGDPQLVGIINSSHSQQGATILRCDGDDNTPKAYKTWMPMVLASIGALPTTIMDRSIVINLRRKKVTEQVTRVPHNLLELNQTYREKIIRWCLDHKRVIEANTVEPNNLGNDRAADNWLPLFTVAHQINTDWINRCEEAYEALTTVPELELPTQLLKDIQQILNQHPQDKIFSEDLLEALHQDTTAPWLTCNNGRKLTASKMSSLLQPYGIKPKVLRIGDKTRRGYEKQQFEDAFDRYLT